MKFTNYTQGPKGLHTKDGLVYVSGGQTVDVEISEAEAKSAKATGWFSKDGAEATAPAPERAPRTDEPKAKA